MPTVVVALFRGCRTAAEGKPGVTERLFGTYLGRTGEFGSIEFDKAIYQYAYAKICDAMPSSP